MQRILILLAVLLSFWSCQQNGTSHSIQYSVSPVTNNGQPMLKVEMRYAIPKGETSDLLFLNDSWGEKELHKTLHNISAISNMSDLEVQTDSNTVRILPIKEGEAMVLEYFIKQDTEGELTTEMTYRPVIQKDYFHVFTHGLFMVPLYYVDNEEAHFNVEINWTGFPEGYTLQNSFGRNQKHQNLTNLSEPEFMEAVFLGGDYRTDSFEIEGNEVVFTTRGEWDVFQDSTVVNILKKTIKAQRRFWNDHSQEYFAVSLTPTVQDRGSSFQGTGLTNSFNCTASNNADLQVEGLVHLFNHELQHNWIGKMIKNENEEEQYWFSEGFTEYYTLKNIVREQIYGFDSGYLIDEMNAAIRALYRSSVVAAPNSEITYDNFWTSRDYEKLPYRRGALFAFYLDQKIIQKSNGKQSLDDAMLQIKNDAHLKDQRLSHAYFLKTLKAYLGDEIETVFKTHMIDGVPFDLGALFTEFGLDYKETAEVFDLGFKSPQPENKAPRTISEIEPESNAYKAGLRKGDVLKGWSYSYNQPESLAEVTVQRKDGLEKITFYPATEVAIPQLLNSEKNKSKFNFK